MRLPYVPLGILVLLLSWPLRHAEAQYSPQLPAQPHAYSVRADVGVGIARLDNDPADNPVTNEGAALGRVLFHDRQLSANGLVACSSCHTQATGFDDRTRFSIGFAGRITGRSAMALGNARYNPRGRYFRDERANTLEQQVLVPFTDEVEMGLKPGGLVARVRSRDWYRPLFAAAFGTGTITEKRIAAALAQFVRSLTTHNSRYDLARRSAESPLEPFASFSELENRGKYLFFANRENGGSGCGSCHESDAFVMTEPKNNGLDAEFGKDDGVGGITGNGDERGLFRTASLKNVALTAPYMHDGRLPDLAAVIDHYSNALQPHPNLSPELRNADGTPVRFNYSDHDKSALIAFLETLTDASFISDERFSDPFSPAGTAIAE